MPRLKSNRFLANAAAKYQTKVPKANRKQMIRKRGKYQSDHYMDLYLISLLILNEKNLIHNFTYFILSMRPGRSKIHPHKIVAQQ